MMMLSKMKFFGVALLMGAFLFCACGKKDPEFERTVLDDLTCYEEVNVETLPFSEVDSEKVSYWVHMYDAFTTEIGTFQFSQENLLLEFCDTATNEISPLCTKANCRHNDESCNAYFSFKDGRPTCLYYDGIYLYYEYSQSTEKTVWYRQNLDGSDRIKVFSINEDFGEGWVVYKDNTVYFVTNVYETNKEVNVDTGGQEGVVKYHIYAGNLVNGEVQSLTCEFSGDLISLQLLGMYEDQLLVSYALTTSLEPLDSLRKVFLYDVMDNTMTGIAAWDSSRNIATCSEAISEGLFPFIKLDMQTEYFVDNEDYAYYEGQLYVADLKAGCCYVLPKQNGMDFILEYSEVKEFYHGREE